ncbi:MAG: viral A-type inclusion protein [Bacteroidetes bacterium]|nr:viral A-type inclusion protein [Fibrella sp.]
MLFRRVFMVIVAGLGVAGCASGTSKETVEAAEKDVFAVHDEVMPQIGTILKLNKQLRHRADSLDSLKATDASATVRIDEEKAQAMRLNRQLNEADSLMMGWMEGYNGDTVQQLKPDAALGYLKAQKTKIDDVKQKINSSIEQAQSYLKK